MGLAAVAFAGALIAPQTLSIAASANAMPSAALDAAGTGLGVAISNQRMTSTVSQVSVGPAGAVHTGDIVLKDGSAGAGLQAVSLSTGLGSTSQALISVSGGVSLAAKP